MMSEAIVISGLSCLFPGAVDAAAFWDLICTNRIATGQTDNLGRCDMLAGAKAGGYAVGVDQFDAGFFGISAREAQLMDPQQRLALQHCWQALEDAGLSPKRLRESQTGVFAGVMATDWSHVYLPDIQELNSQTVTGNGHALIANRISYLFDLKGPSLTLDTACSSALVALHYAVRSIQAGECDQALVIGVNVIARPSLQIFYERAGLTSRGGQCKPFSHQADGILRGEGIGVLVLQREKAALRPYARVKGSWVNHDGQSNGLTAPNRAAQVALLNAAYRQAGVSIDDMAYIEGHGTATQLGDRIELQALQEVFAGRKAARPCELGSVKGLIGHTEAAAGMAGTIKVALQLQQRWLAPHLWADEANTGLQADGPIVLRSQGRHLEADEAGLMGISAFGLGGTNAHLILEPVLVPQPKPAMPVGPHLFLLAGHSDTALNSQLGQLRTHLNQFDEAGLPALAAAYAWQRSDGAYRAAILGQHAKDLQTRLITAVTRPAYAPPNRPIVFLFTGQGAQYPGMMRQFYQRYAAFRLAADECDELFQHALGYSVIQQLFQESGETLLQRSAFAQAALFIVEYALGQFWLSLDIKPQAVIGHSIGEFAAACLSGVLTLKQAVNIVAIRGQLLDSLSTEGGMLAVWSEPEAFADLLAQHAKHLAIAAFNGPRELVFSGTLASLAAVKNRAIELGLRSRSLKVTHAFHSPLLQSVGADLRNMLQSLGPGQVPQIPFYSTYKGALHNGPFDADYWVEQFLSPVQFTQALAQLEADLGPVTGIEIGPAPVLSLLAQRQERATDSRWFASSLADPKDSGTILETLAELYLQAYAINWQPIFEPACLRTPEARLPAYVFETTSFWPKNQPVKATQQADESPQQNLAERVASASSAALQEQDVAVFIRQQIAHILQAELTRITDQARFAEDLGMDSVTLIELQGRLNAALPAAAQLSLAEAVQLPTVGALIQRLEEKLQTCPV